MSCEIVLLGAAQDGGLPQVNCNCKNCSDIRRGIIDEKNGYVVCLGIVDIIGKQYWLIDATPDIKNQLYYMSQKYQGYTFQGIFLTHLHMGHYTGLLQLGKEGANFKNLNIYLTDRASSFLQSNDPWAYYVQNNNFQLNIIKPEIAVQVCEGINITPIIVPHRGEFSDTVAFSIQYIGKQSNQNGQKCKLFYCPDIDDWSKWDVNIGEFFYGFQVALVDGTFYDESELPGRDLSKIPHPFISTSLDLFSSQVVDLSKINICFIHLNHSNPCWQESKEKKEVEKRGFMFAKFGQIF